MNFDAQYFTYTPTCPGPWSKVIFNADFNITTGIQFDRTAEISIGYANIYYGTTREDTPNFGPTWHVERDLTDYSSLFNISQPGEVDLGNLVSPPYTGIIYGTASINFYPVADGGTAPVVADAVYPMPDAPGGAVALNTTTDQLTGTFTLPTNIEKAYLDVITQSQSNDEFWYTCVPNDVTSELESCGNTAFREAEITIDGTPAGVAPVYPWIFTGGIDPYLWLPIPGLQTLNFTPYRVDLSPFAGILSNGQPHTVALSVFNANSYFLTTASLLIYEDHGSSQVTGGVTENTLAAAPTPMVTENLFTGQNGDISGSVVVTSDRGAAISGYVNTSHGVMTTALNQNFTFNNTQRFSITATKYVQAINQVSKVSSTTTTTSAGVTVVDESFLDYPLTLSINEEVQVSGDVNLTTKVNQEYMLGTKELVNGATSDGSEESNVFEGTDTLLLDSGFNIIGNQDQRSSKTSTTMNPGAGCKQTVEKAAEDHVLSTTTGPCPAN